MGLWGYGVMGLWGYGVMGLWGYGVMEASQPRGEERGVSWKPRCKRLGCGSGPS
jgi:hypothetical protein